jgi:hypothetical protein
LEETQSKRKIGTAYGTKKMRKITYKWKYEIEATTTPHTYTVLQFVDPSQLQDTLNKLSRVHKRRKGNTQRKSKPV